MVMNQAPKSALRSFYEFFEKTGMERLNGLDSGYFDDMTPSEREQAWNYLKDQFELSSERIQGLYVLKPKAAVDLFKQAIDKPIPESPYPAARQAAQENRVRMLGYICRLEPSSDHINALAELGKSEFPQVRSTVAQALPTNKITPEAIATLKSMIFTETDRLNLSAAINKLLAIYGLDFDRNDPNYKSLYIGLRSEDAKSKTNAFNKLEAQGHPDYL